MNTPMTLPVATLIDRVKKMKADYYEQNTYVSLDLDHIISSLEKIKAEIDRDQTDSVIIGYKHEFNDTFEDITGRSMTDSEWFYDVKDKVEQDEGFLNETDSFIRDLVTDLAYKVQDEEGDCEEV